MQRFPIVAGTTATYPADLVKDIDANYAGCAVVVVIQANLIPDVLRALGVENPPPIATINTTTSSLSRGEPLLPQRSGPSDTAS